MQSSRVLRYFVSLLILRTLLLATANLSLVLLLANGMDPCVFSRTPFDSIPHRQSLQILLYARSTDKFGFSNKSAGALYAW